MERSALVMRNRRWETEASPIVLFNSTCNLVSSSTRHPVCGGVGVGWSKSANARAASAVRGLKRSTQPTISSIERAPMPARRSRTSLASPRKKVSTISGFPVKRVRNLSSCVAMPTGQVFR